MEDGGWSLKSSNSSNSSSKEGRIGMKVESRRRTKELFSLPMTGSRLELMIQDFPAKLISRLGPWSSPPETSMTDSDILAKKLAKHEKGHHLKQDN